MRERQHIVCQMEVDNDEDSDDYQRSQKFYVQIWNILVSHNNHIWCKRSYKYMATISPPWLMFCQQMPNRIWKQKQMTHCAEVYHLQVPAGRSDRPLSVRGSSLPV